MSEQYAFTNMSILDNSSTEQVAFAYPDMIFSLTVRFWLYLVSNIFSLICCLFVLYCILFDRTLRHSLNNHTIIVLLFNCLLFESTDIPFILYYYRYGTVWSTSPAFSLFWSFIDFGSYSTQFIIFAWSTIERHILIFHSGWISTTKKRFYIHYLPLIILSLYCVLYYSLIIFGPFCENTFYQGFLNGVPFPCIFNITFFKEWELLCHQFIPILIITFFSLALFLRILWQRTRLHRAINWRKQRRMAIQLLSISILYLCLSAPGTFLVLSYEFGVPRNSGVSLLPYSTFFSHYIVFLLPFLCWKTSPEIHNKLKKLFICPRKPRKIAPKIIHVTHRCLRQGQAIIH